MCVSKHCVTKNGSLFGIPINHHSLFSSIIYSNHVGLLGCKMFYPPIENMDRSITNFGSILAFITIFFTNFSFITMFWLLVPLCPTCLTVPNLHLEGVETCHALNEFIQAFLQGSLAPSCRYQSNTSLMQRLIRPSIS